MSHPLFVHIFMTESEITEVFRFAGCDKAAPPKVLIAVNNFFLPVIKFKFNFETKTPVF